MAETGNSGSPNNAIIDMVKAERENQPSTSIFKRIGNVIKEEWSPSDKRIRGWDVIKEDTMDLLYKKDPEERIFSTLLKSRSEYKNSSEKPESEKQNKSSKKKLSKEEKKAKKRREKAAKGKIKHARGKALCNAAKPLSNNGGKIFKRGTKLIRAGGKKILQGFLKITKGVAELAIGVAKIAAGTVMLVAAGIALCTIVGSAAAAAMASQAASLLAQGAASMGRGLGRIATGMVQMGLGTAQLAAGMAAAMTGKMMQITGKLMDKRGQSLQRKGNEMMRANGQDMGITQGNLNTNALNQSLDMGSAQAQAGNSENSNDGGAQPSNGGSSQGSNQTSKESSGIGDIAKDVALGVGTGMVMDQLAKGKDGKKAQTVDRQAQARNDKDNPLNSIPAKKWDAIQKKQDKVQKRYDALMKSGQNDKAAEELSRFEQQLSGKGKKGDFGLNKEQMAAFKDANKDKFPEWQPKQPTQARALDPNLLAQSRLNGPDYGK